MTTTTLVPEVDHTWPLRVSMSADGRYIVFANYFALEQANIVADATLDVFRVDTQTGQLQMVSLHTATLSRADSPVISSDGTLVAFRSMLDVDHGTTLFGVAVKNMATGALVQLAGASAASPFYYDTVTMSGNGSLVAYTTRASYGDTQAERLLAQDVQSKKIVYQQDGLASVQSLQLSGDGKSLLIVDRGVRVVDLNNGVSQALAGADTTNASVSFSADGRYVLYAARSSAVTAGSSDDQVALVRKDLQSGAVKVVTEVAASAWDQSYHNELMSPDGSLVAYRGDPMTHAWGTPNGALIIVNMDTGAVSLPLGSTGSGSLEALGNGAGILQTASESHPNYMTEGTLKLMTLTSGVARTGTDGNDVLTGTDGPDRLSGLGGGDRITGGAGDDMIDGGAGIDTAFYAGKRAAYTVTAGAETGSWAVRDTSGAEGTDLLHNVERLHFADTELGLDVAGTAGQAYRIYQAAFARTPDLPGLGYWIGVMDRGATLRAVAEGFVNSDEFRTLYGEHPRNRAIVEKFYENVLHRAGEEAGVAWWTDVLDRKAGTIADVLVGFSESAENQAALVGVMEHGVVFTPFP
jgi:Tol biopolymer transport system component